MDDVLTVDTLAGDVGSSVTLSALLVVDGSNVISDAAELDRYEVTAEILGPVAGPKINMIHYKNKTGYRRRLGHRQHYTQLKITGIGTEKKQRREVRCRQEQCRQGRCRQVWYRQDQSAAARRRAELTWHTRRARPPAVTAVTPRRSASA